MNRDPPSGARIPTASDPGPRSTTRNRRPTSATTRYFWPRVIVETSWTSIGTGRGEAIVEDIDSRRHTMHVAIENFAHDANIGTVVRTANAFAAAAVHIVGRRRWNRRGAMVTDRYQHIVHHADIGELVEYARENSLTIVAVDNTPGSVPLETASLPRECILLFGQEGPGVTDHAKEVASMTVSIAQFGSTRSINAGVAAGIAMHAWVREHADLADSR